ncbi:hypothetical protein KSD_96810 [Ktedonobacter sp. SOSP1-85]|nr:hypothetical protein KSD_96810 [Ktedonobacter sp. SOSP1-85]
MKAYSQDLRERVLRAVDRGCPRTEIVRLFGISRASIKRYIKQRRENGPRGEKKPTAFQQMRWFLLMKLAPTLP